MKNILFFFGFAILFSCSKNNDPTPVKEGRFAMQYKIANNRSNTQTNINISFGHYENAGQSMMYEGHKSFVISPSKIVSFSFDTLVKADFVKLTISAPNLIDPAQIILNYNGNSLYNQTLEYSAISSGFNKDIKF